MISIQNRGQHDELYGIFERFMTSISSIKYLQLLITSFFLLHGACSYKFLILTKFLFLPIINCIISIYISSSIDYDNLYFQFYLVIFKIFLKPFMFTTSHCIVVYLGTHYRLFIYLIHVVYIVQLPHLKLLNYMQDDYKKSCRSKKIQCERFFQFCNQGFTCNQPVEGSD
jgi:hypothetical protein